MANVDAPMGAEIKRHLHGAPFNGQVRRYKKEASVILGMGDPVVLTGDSDSDGVALITRAGGTGAITTITGFVVAIDPVRTDLSKNYFAAADQGYVLVADAPDLIIEMQEDSVGGALAGTDVGQGCDLVAALDADTTTGRSKFEIDSSTAASSGVQLRIMQLAQRDDNAIGTNANWDCMVVEHTYNPHTLI